MVFGFVKSLLGFKTGGVITDGKLNPTNMGVMPSRKNPPRLVTTLKPRPFFGFKLGGVIKLKKRKRKCGCKCKK